MAKKTKRFLVIGVAVLVVLGTIALAFLLPTASATATPMLSISFVSLTNSAAGGPAAVFLVKNPHSRPVDFSVAVPQVHLTSGWPEDISWPPTAMFHLAEHQSTNFTVSPPTDGLCRVPILNHFVPNQFDHWRDVLKVNWEIYRETRRFPGLNIGSRVPLWTNFTDELNFSIEP